MIAFLKGKLIHIMKDSIILNVNNVGYRLLFPNSALAKLPNVEESLTVYTYLAVRDDNLQLYGFLYEDELEIFTKIISVSGVGPKNALSLISTYSPLDIKNIISTRDIVSLTKVPGIGKKTAERIVLELKDKFKDIILSKTAAGVLHDNHESSVIDDAVKGLKALGYSAKEAANAVSKVFESNKHKDASELIKEALKYLV